MIRNSLIILATIALLLFFPSLWVPSFQEWASARVRLEESTARLENLKNYKTLLRETKKRLEEQKDTLEKVKALVPLSPNTTEFLYSLEVLATSHNLILQDVSVSQEKVFPGNSYLVYIPITLKATGDYGNVKGFILDLEKGERLVSIDSVKLSSFEGKEGEEGTINLDLSFRIFYLKRGE